MIGDIVASAAFALVLSTGAARPPVAWWQHLRISCSKGTRAQSFA
jgi:hypothetical protein